MIPKPLLNLTVNLIGSDLIVICENDLFIVFIEFEFTNILCFLKHFKSLYLYCFKYCSVESFMLFFGRVHIFFVGLLLNTIAFDIYICSFVIYEF